MNKDQALKGKVVVKLGGKELTLSIDFNCLAELESETGENPLTGKFWQVFLKNLGPKKMLSLFWAMSRSYHPELSKEDIGRLLSLENQGDILGLIKGVTGMSLGNQNLKKNSSKQPEEAARKEAALTGSSTGPSEDTPSASPTKSLEG